MTPQATEALAKLSVVMMFIWIVGFAIFIMWILALIDALRSEFENQSNKIIWVLMLLFLAPFAAVLYPMIAESQKVKTVSKKYEMNEKLSNFLEVENYTDRDQEHPEREKALMKNQWF